MNAEIILRNYEALSGVTERMLAAARGEDWDELIRLEEECRSIVESIQVHGGISMNQDEQRRKARIIRKLLADDAEIRARTVDWMARLEKLLQGSRRERHAHRAYDDTRGM